MPGLYQALVVDDDEALRRVSAEVLARDGWKVQQAELGEGVADLVRAHPFGFVLLDQRLPDADGVELVEQIRENGYTGTAVVMTGYPTVQKAVEALGCAADDYLCKPVDTGRLLELSAKARQGCRPEPDWQFLWASLEKRYGFSNLLSSDEATRDCYMAAARVADSRAPVLIEGETGTGKEYLARAIHYMSQRSDGPFVAVNCGAIPDTLVESELFGHEKGAFTSATSAKKGLCELAGGGTLLLDEVGELSPAAQVKLLRFLQDRALTRLGGLQPISVDVRVIAATNRDLMEATAQERFREDLYYRIAVVPLRLPPLRDRRDDLPRYARHFLKQVRREMQGGPTDFDPEARELLQSHSWPGNLRELSNVVQRGALFARGDLIRPRDLCFVGPRGALAAA